MNDADGSPNEAWVTVFGFPPGSLAAVLEAFQRDGDVVTHDSFASLAPANGLGGRQRKRVGTQLGARAVRDGRGGGEGAST